MDYKNPEVKRAAEKLREEFEKLANKREILRSPELLALYESIKLLPPAKRASFGKEVNQLKTELEELIESQQKPTKELPPIDITAPFDTNVPSELRPELLPAEYGSRHPLTTELKKILDIFARMGFEAVESREIDD